jgi:CcmD family protein
MTDSKHRGNSLVALVLVSVFALALGVGLGARTQPPASPQPTPSTPSPAQEGFVPIDQLQAKEQIPAAPLVIAAYVVAWVAVFAYVWSIWQRLGRVEREIADVSRRLESRSPSRR